jgi:epoxyqueuosine reductase
MEYLARRREAYRHPRSVLPGAVSLLMVGMNYCTSAPDEACRPGHGRISRYAWGDVDYHDLVRDRLKQLGERAGELRPGVVWRAVVDTAPLLEREFAALAGIGWQGKNTMLISPRAGSWFYLGALLLDVELDYDQPITTDHCGTCTACLDACPTQAFVAPRQLDATRCISYLTIEQRGAVPLELRAGVGEWLYGCDVCQEVCPWNRFAEGSDETGLVPIEPSGQFELASLFSWTEAMFRDRFRYTAMWRARRRGLLRNAAIVLGNEGSPSAVAALSGGLNDADAVVRGAAAWALGKIGSPSCRELLQVALAKECDPLVIGEINQALGQS